MVNKAISLFYTVKYLKPIQVFYQLKYRIKKAGNLTDYKKNYNIEGICFLFFKNLPPVFPCYLGKNEFVFLNLKVKFDSRINWNYQDNGKLWNYNLQYANYLLQENVSVEERKELIISLYRALYQGELPLEPYPASLRIINSVRFLSNYGLYDEELCSLIHAELDFLSKRPEYHILGNHLFENGFALFMGGAFFQNIKWIDKGKTIIESELTEQILSDGAHFELSPMYHQIILFRLLELIDWYSNWRDKDHDFQKQVMVKAGAMCSWLKQMSFRDGNIPHFNDSAEGIAYSTDWLLSYADELKIQSTILPLGEAGYRNFNKGDYECRVDAGQVGPSYQPGHAHADALSFILYYKQEPLFTEVGTSTYQIGHIRTLERSTSSHNTVVVANTNQSNVWSGFRVAERAKIKITKDTKNHLNAVHDGYRKFGIIHSRSFEFQDREIVIIDETLGNKMIVKQFHLHLHPNIKIEEANKLTVTLSNDVCINFEGAHVIEFENYNMAHGYNNYIQGKKIVVTFAEVLKTTISFKD